MIGRILLGVFVAAASLTVPVTSAQAFFHNWCRRPTTAYYAPVATAAPACCPQPQVVNYMPQTCYRTVYVNQPVVTYRPTTACDACGRATTVMRPVTSFVRQPRLVPYTTYRPVATTVARPCCATTVARPCCGAAPTTTYYAPAVRAAPAAPCCTPVSARTIAPAPAVAPYNPAPVASPIPAGTPPGATPVPSLNSAPSTPAPQQTFSVPSPLDSNQPRSRVLLPPSGDSSSTLGRPRGLDPQSSLDRTTAIPLRRTAARPASLVRQSSVEAPLSDDGWRAAK